jgi:outer membrane protein, heavy metal efflux system
MRSRHLRAAVAAALLAAAGPAAAQAPPPEPLRLGAVYDALAAHPMVAAAEAGARAGEARIGPAGRWPDPTLQLGLMGRMLPGLGLQDPLGMTTLQVTQMVPLGGKTGPAVRAERARADASRERVAGAVWETRNRAAMAFYDLYAAERAVELGRDSRGLLASTVLIARAMYAEGQGRQSDVLKAEVELARMEEEIVRMEAMRETMRGRMNALLARPLDAPVGAPLLPAFPALLPARDSLERVALAGRPALLAGEREIAAADASVLLARREIWPDLEVGVQYGQRPMAGGGTDRMVSLMLGASVPVNPGRRQTPMRLEAEAMRDMARADLAALRAETRGQVGELVARVESARKLIPLYRETVLPQADAGATSALAAYREGAIDLMALLDARMGVNRYRLALAQLEADLGKALAELEMLTATALVDPNTVAPATGGLR